MRFRTAGNPALSSVDCVCESRIHRGCEVERATLPCSREKGGIGIFAGLHKRYGRDGIYDESSDEALMAHRVRGFLRSTPVLLLTATPMQNSLVELWGLVQYVEPTGTLLGDIATFRKVFCDEDDRTLVAGQEHDLQRRLAIVLQRTLRRQAQVFLTGLSLNGAAGCTSTR
jgi:hypothetical protein